MSFFSFGRMMGPGGSSGDNNAAIIAAFFAAGGQGAWYDPTDITTLFQDAAGTVPVTASGDPVGKMLDKSGNGVHVTQATTTKRPLYNVDGSGYKSLLFDGVDDCLFSATNLVLNGSPKALHCSGAKSIGTGVTMVYEKNTAAANTGDIYFAIASAIGYQASFNTGTQFVNSLETITVTNKNVLTNIGDSTQSVANSITFRANGSAIAVTNAGAVNGLAYGADPIYLGARANASLFWNGNMYGLIFAGGNVTAAQLKAIESYIGSDMGITIP